MTHYRIRARDDLRLALESYRIEMEKRTGIRIPANELGAETLRNVIEEFVTRDGTDLGEAEAKVARVQELLRRGEVEIWFDERTRTCNIHKV